MAENGRAQLLFKPLGDDSSPNITRYDVLATPLTLFNREVTCQCRKGMSEFLCKIISAHAAMDPELRWRIAGQNWQGKEKCAGILTIVRRQTRVAVETKLALHEDSVRTLF